MNDLLIAIIIGLVAGLIDVTPMVIMKLEKVANISAFVHYFVLGLIIPLYPFGVLHLDLSEAAEYLWQKKKT